GSGGPWTGGCAPLCPLGRRGEGALGAAAAGWDRGPRTPPARPPTRPAGPCPILECGPLRHPSAAYAASIRIVGLRPAALEPPKPGSTIERRPILPPARSSISSAGSSIE